MSHVPRTLHAIMLYVSHAPLISKVPRTQLALVLYLSFYFSIWAFFHENSRFTGQQRKWETISLANLYHFHPLQGHFDISRVITADSLPLHISSSWTPTGKLWFLSACFQPLSYAPFNLGALVPLVPHLFQVSHIQHTLMYLISCYSCVLRLYVFGISAI